MGYEKYSLFIRIRIRIVLSNRRPTRGKVITVIHKQLTLKNKNKNKNIIRYNEQNCP